MNVSPIRIPSGFASWNLRANGAVRTSKERATRGLHKLAHLSLAQGQQVATQELPVCRLRASLVLNGFGRKQDPSSAVAGDRHVSDFRLCKQVANRPMFLLKVSNHAWGDITFAKHFAASELKPRHPDIPSWLPQVHRPANRLSPHGTNSLPVLLSARGLPRKLEFPTLPLQSHQTCGSIDAKQHTKACGR